MTGEGWQRLHPLSPVVRGGRATIAIAVLLLPSVLGGRSLSHSYVELGIAGGLTALGFISWYVTRWRIDGDDLRIETGVIRRESRRYPLAQVQAIDVVRPGLARLFRVAELRLRTGGSTGAGARLAYLPERDAEALRDRLLALAAGAREGAREPVAGPAPDEAILVTVPTGRLVASILISDVGFLAEAVLAGLIVAAFLSPSAARAAGGAGAVWIFGVLTLVWRRFNQDYRLTLAEAPDGLRLRSGLVALTAETIRPGRVQAVRMVEPFLWRPLGWCRLEVALAGRQRSKGEGEAERGQLRSVLPVGSPAVARGLLARIVADAPHELSPAPRRALWKTPLRYRMLGWARTDTCVATRSGRLRRVTSWVPLEKAQSLRWVQGPIQRRLRLASVHVDTPGRGVRATIRDRDEAEAEQALVELTDLARAVRRTSAHGLSPRRHGREGARADVPPRRPS